MAGPTGSSWGRATSRSAMRHGNPASGQRLDRGRVPVDADRDGVLDLVTLNHFGPARAWRGLGGGRFELAPGLLGGLDSRLTFGGLVADLDRDGALDLYLSGATSGTGRRMIERIARVSNGEPLASIGSMAAGNVVLRGTAEGLQPQADTGAEQAGWSWGTAATDLDLDGNLDLLSVNGFVTGTCPTTREDLLAPRGGVRAEATGHSFEGSESEQEASIRGSCTWTVGGALQAAAQPGVRGDRRRPLRGPLLLLGTDSVWTAARS